MKKATVTQITFTPQEAKLTETALADLMIDRPEGSESSKIATELFERYAKTHRQASEMVMGFTEQDLSYLRNALLDRLFVLESKNSEMAQEAVGVINEMLVTLDQD